MSSVIAHAMSAALIALTAADVAPHETGYLVADWADGATGRRYNRCSRSGYLLDVVTDRACESLILPPLPERLSASGVYRAARAAA